MDHKIGVYIDTGYGIGEALDIEALSNVATSEFKVAVCKAEPYWSEKDKLEIIKKRYRGARLDHSDHRRPSSRVFQQEFKFDGVITRGSIFASTWSGASPRTTKTPRCWRKTMSAWESPRPRKYEDRARLHGGSGQRHLVIGGGVTGMTAALEAAAAGYQVYLVEKDPQLGGWANKFHKVFTGTAPYEDIEDSPFQDKIAAVNGNSKIKVFTSSRVYSIGGAPGMFDVVIRPDGPWNDSLVKKQNEWLAAKLAKEAGAQKEEEKAQKTEEETTRQLRKRLNRRISSTRPFGWAA